MRRLILIGLFTGFLTPADLHAQKAYKEGSAVILDMTVAAGMPADVVTTTGKYSSFTPNVSALGTNNDHNGSINATVYHKLEIAPYDLNGNGTIGNTGSTFTFTWVNAFNYCESVNHNGSGWRLPTQRELMMMWIFKPALGSLFSDTDVGGSAFNGATYWSATEYNGGNSWGVSLGNGGMGTNTKGGGYRVRCVREITD